MLKARMTSNDSPWVFPRASKATDNGFLSTSLDHQHSTAITTLGLPKDFVLHSLRHTFLRRLAEAGVDAFTIMRIAGHSSVTDSQKYSTARQRQWNGPSSGLKLSMLPSSQSRRGSRRRQKKAA